MALATRPAQVMSQFSGAQSAATFLEEQVLFSETSPLWNSPTHADCLAPIRLAIARAINVSIVDYDHDLANSVLVDLLIDALALGVRLSYTALQVQHMLLLVWETHSDVVAIQAAPSPSQQSHVDDSAAALAFDTDALEGYIARRLTKRLAAVACCQPTACIETRTVKDVTMQERIDPVALAAWEAKKNDPKTNKKQLQALEEAYKTLPKAMVEVVVERQVEVETTVGIGPVFSYNDIAHMMQFISDTLLAHWRLYRHCVVTQRQVSERVIPVWVQDVPTFAIPPLSAALSERDYLDLCAREAAWEEVEQTIEASFQTLFVIPLTSMHSTISKLLSEAHVRELEAMRADQQAAMPQDEFVQAVQVLTRRIAQRASHNHHVGHADKTTATTAVPATLTAPPSATPVRSPQHPISSGAVTPPSARRQSVASTSTSVPPTPKPMVSSASSEVDVVVAADRAVAVSDVFRFEEVDSKLNHLHDMFNKAFAAAPPPGAKPARK